MLYPVFTDFTFFHIVRIEGQWRDYAQSRDLPNGVTRGHVIQYTTMTEKMTNIHAYC